MLFIILPYSLFIADDTEQDILLHWISPNQGWDIIQTIKRWKDYGIYPGHNGTQDSQENFSRKSQGEVYEENSDLKIQG